MTRRDFVLLSSALRARRPLVAAALPGYRLAVIAIADALAEKNPRFDRALFLDDCGIVA